MLKYRKNISTRREQGLSRVGTLVPVMSLKALLRDKIIIQVIDILTII